MTPGLKPSQPSQGQLSSLDSDDFGTILEREETLQMLRRNPSPAKWRRVDAVSIDRAKKLSSLDLTVPDRLQHASAASLEEQGLAGYQALQHGAIAASNLGLQGPGEAALTPCFLGRCSDSARRGRQVPPGVQRLAAGRGEGRAR